MPRPPEATGEADLPGFGGPHPGGPAGADPTGPAGADPGGPAGADGDGLARADGGGPASADPPGLLEERVVASHLVHRGRYLSLRVDTIERADGSRSEREIVGHPGAVAIVAVDGSDRLALVRQFRLATGGTLLEIPAGTLDVTVDGRVEDPERAARRELEEETGLRAETWRRLGSFWTAPGFATERMHLYLATDLAAASDRIGPDADERLELVWLPFAEVLEAALRGEIADAKSLVGIFWYGWLRTARGREPWAAPRLGR